MHLKNLPLFEGCSLLTASLGQPDVCDGHGKEHIGSKRLRAKRVGGLGFGRIHGPGGGTRVCFTAALSVLKVLIQLYLIY